ncbi:MAG: tetratricopeptide repeat protein, partial [Brevinematia bacterium]
GAFKDELYIVSESQFKIIIDQYPNSRYFQDSLYYLLLSQYFQKKHQEALNTISLIESKYKYIKHFPKVLYIKGRIQFDIQDYKNSIRTFENYLKNYPIDEDAPYAGYYMAMSYYNLKNNQRAIEILENLEKDYQNAPIIEDVKFRIAKIYFENQDLDKSYIKLKELEENYPNSKYIPEILYTIGKILYQKGTYQTIQTNLIYDAAMYFQKSSEVRSPLKPYSLFNSGIAFLTIGQLEKSKDLFSKLIEEFSISSDSNIKDMVNEATYNLGKIYNLLGNYEESIRSFKLAISQSGKFSTISLIELADILNSQGNTEEAINLLSEYTNNNEILLKYSQILENTKPDESERILFQIITSKDAEQDIKNEAIVQILKLLLRKGKYDQIISNFKTFSENSKDDFTLSFVYFALAEANLNTKDYKSAISSYSQVTHQSLKEDAIEGIAYSHYLSENYNLAIKYYTDLITVYGSKKYIDRANYLIGVCYEKIKKTEDAKKYYLELIKNGKDRKYINSAIINLGWIYVREKNFDKAISLALENLKQDKDKNTYENLSEILVWSYDGKAEYQKAIEVLSNLISLDDISELQKIRYYNYISLFYEKQNNMKKAIEIIEKEVIPISSKQNLTNHIIEGIGRIIEISIKLEDRTKLKNYTTELKTKYKDFQKSYEYLYKYCEYLYTKGEYEEAGNEFLFIARNSQDPAIRDEAYFWGGWSYYNAKRINDAINMFSEFTTKSTSSKVPNALLTLGDIIANQGNFSEARKHYQRIVNEFKNSPEYNEAIIRLSKISKIDQKSSQMQEYKPSQKTTKEQNQNISQKNIDEIISSLELVSKSKDKESASKAKLELAMIYKSQRNYQKAINLLQEITEEVFSETAAIAQFEIGEILRINGDYNKAVIEYIKVSYIYKEYKDIVVKSLYYAIICYIQIKEIDQAKKIYEKMMKDFYKNTWTEKAKELIEKYY